MKKTYLPDDLSFYDDEESNDALQKTIEDDIAYYKANPKYPPKAEFSEDYEKKLKATLERLLGDDAAEQVLAAREDKNLHVLTEEECLQNVQEYEEMLKEFEIKKGKARRRKSFKVGAAAACIGIVLLTSGVFGMKSNALKSAFSEFFEQDQNEYTILEVQGDDEYPTEIMHKYAPSVVLDGYELINIYEQLLFVTYIYQNQDGDVYHYVQATYEVSEWIDSEAAEVTEYNTVFGNAFYYQKDSIDKFVWHFDGYFFRIEGKISQEDMLTIANSLRIVEEE